MSSGRDIPMSRAALAWREATLLHDVGDLDDGVRRREMRLWVWKTEVSKDVSRADNADRRLGRSNRNTASDKPNRFFLTRPQYRIRVLFRGISEPANRPLSGHAPRLSSHPHCKETARGPELVGSSDALLHWYFVSLEIVTSLACSLIEASSPRVGGSAKGRRHQVIVQRAAYRRAVRCLGPRRSLTRPL